MGWPQTSRRTLRPCTCPAHEDRISEAASHWRESWCALSNTRAALCPDVLGKYPSSLGESWGSQEGKPAVEDPRYGVCPVIFTMGSPLLPSVLQLNPFSPVEPVSLLTPNHSECLPVSTGCSSPPGFLHLFLLTIYLGHSKTWLKSFRFSLATMTHI